MQPHKIVSHEEWLAARKAHLADEKAFTRARDALSKKRRELPVGESRKGLCVRRAGRQGNARRPIRRQEPADRLSLHARPRTGKPAARAARFWPIILTAWPSISRNATSPLSSSRGLRSPRSRNSRSAWAGSLNGCRRSATTSTSIIRFRHRRRRRQSGKVTYNYEVTTFPSEERPGASVFYKNAGGEVFHTYSTYGRGLDILIGAYNFLDVAPKGRDEEGLAYGMAWVRHHDRYDGALIDPKASYQEPHKSDSLLRLNQ